MNWKVHSGLSFPLLQGGAESLLSFSKGACVCSVPSEHHFVHFYFQDLVLSLLCPSVHTPVLVRVVSNSVSLTDRWNWQQDARGG